MNNTGFNFNWNDMISGKCFTIGDLLRTNIITPNTCMHVIINSGDIIDKYFTAYDLYTEGESTTTLAAYDCEVIRKSKLERMTASLVDGKPFITIEGNVMVNDVITILLYEMINLWDKSDRMVVNINNRGKEDKYIFGIDNIRDDSPIDMKYSMIAHLILSILGVDICKTQYESMTSTYTGDHEKTVNIII